MNARRAVANRVAVLLLVIGGIPGGAPANSPASAKPGAPGRAEYPGQPRSLWSRGTPAAKTIAVEGPSSQTAQASPAPASSASAKKPPASAAPSGQPQDIPKLGARQRAEKLRELSEEDRQWVTEYVAPIILPEELNLFLQLPLEYQREAFRKEFWSRRERDGLAPPLGPGYQARYGHLRELAAEEYDGLTSDAGRMVVRLGEPASIELLNECSDVFRQGEVWTYLNATSSRAIRHLFYRPSFGAPRRLWLSGDPEIFQTASCLRSFDQACARGPRGVPPSSPGVPCGGSMTVPKTCRDACDVSRVAEEIAARGAREASIANSAPAVSTEGLEGLWNRYASLSTGGAKPLSIESAGTRTAAAAPAAPAAGAEEAQAAPDWSNEAIRTRILALPKKYREWLELAGPLLSETELVVFLQLPPAGRDGYIRKFWKLHAHAK